MMYIKGFLAGIAGAILFAGLWIIVSFILPIFGPAVLDRFLNQGGASAARISSASILLAALIGFVLAACWALRRFGAP
jgi:hypothetical protein